MPNRPGSWRLGATWILPTGCLLSLICVLGVAFAGFLVLRQMGAAIVAQVSQGRTIDYHMPKAAKIIQEDTSLADWFGDFSYCVAFRLPDSEITHLHDLGFDWIEPVEQESVSTSQPDWKEGSLPEEFFREIEGLDVDLTIGPRPLASYKYLHEEDAELWRLLVIDEQEGVIYYYRSSH